MLKLNQNMKYDDDGQQENSQLKAEPEGNISTCVMPSLTRPEGSVCSFFFLD